mmetsp:Transcript_52297/g.60041  ORF Transcript_52297/g.60041 Transcript_52297/m.60041 type:complete len:419 (+) Transcript_52297:38-1294(+)
MCEIQKVYLFASSFVSHKILTALEFTGTKAEVEFMTYEKTKTPEFLAKNPNGKLPCADTSKGPLYESHAILRAIARAHPDKHLYGKTAFQTGKVDQWLDWVNGEYQPSIISTHGAVVGYVCIDEKTYSDNLENLKKKLHVLEEHLGGSQFLVGDHVTIADIALVCASRAAAVTIFEPEFRKAFPNFFNYFHAVASLPAMLKVLGRVRYNEGRFDLYVAPKKEEVKKEEKKPAAAKPKKKDDDEEEEEAEAPKKDDGKAELDNLPPSNFNFYDFKTLITNAKDKKEAVNEFWNLFDKEGYSLWFVEYEKAPGEGKVVYLTNNLMNGFLQRLDHFRKYCYGVYGVYGDEPNLEVRGVFCWRGNFIPLMVKQHDQYDYHRFTKLDPSNEADRKKVEEFWTKFNEDEDVVDGLTARTVKYFK